ncbi:MAG: PHP domain-containing protein [Chloroflexota bacterium]|nr:PHP domain-containing protein [Chloroflexota bacterium]
MLKADLHIHTQYSMDCATPLEAIIKRCQALGINCIAIADHGTTEGAFKMQAIAPFKVIIAEEMITPHGEIMGMFLKEEIPSHLSVEETIARIRDQDALVCIPHPFDKIRHSALDDDTLEQIVEEIDVLEVFNSKVIFPRTLARARLFAAKYSLPQSAGSDAHSIYEVGNAYVEMPEFSDKDDFLQALAQGKIYGRRTNPLARFASAWTKLKKGLKA